jgi:hypothetical protein
MIIFRILSSQLFLLFFFFKLAPGLTREFTVMLLAMYRETSTTTSSSGQSPRLVRNLVHELEILTETDAIKLTIEAEIATAEEFRRMYKGNMEAGKEKNVKILSVRPGSTKEVLTKQFSAQSANKLDANFEYRSIKKSESMESFDKLMD